MSNPIMHSIAVGALFAAGLTGQVLDPAQLLHPSSDTWPMYNGDYSGRRFSPLMKVNTSNIDSLSLAWVFRINAGDSGGFGGAIKSTPVLLNGILYFTIPDHVWAIDARDGREVWSYTWQSKGGIHIGNRGVAVSGNWLYFETPDCNLVSLNLKDGKERWHAPICDLDQLYFGSIAPLVIKNHIITGVSGDDLDIPGYMEAHDPETGALQWRWYTHPSVGDAEAKTWPTVDAMMHGGGMTWGPSTYDPELNLLYFGTGNPQPVIAGKARKGDNLYTESIVALNPDTGEMQWYFQPSPHDTHDWDAIEVPMLIDGTTRSSNAVFSTIPRPEPELFPGASYYHTVELETTDLNEQRIQQVLVELREEDQTPGTASLSEYSRVRLAAS